ncbi:MAG: peptidase T [Pirellulaceae bacterium]|nr:peptidase T [Pirellulaceae bacterium]
MSRFPINSTRLLERFLRYVKIGTAADADSKTYPSTKGQLELGRLLVEELKAMSADDVHQDEHGLVWATVPATVPSNLSGSLPTILFNAHLDTSPEAPGDNVKPQVIECYQGGDIPLPAGNTITTSGCPALLSMIGHCLVTTDGTTLLGGDDKAGVAAIMELAHHLIEYPSIPHGPIRILFTCDEEIGNGTGHVDMAKTQAIAAYTLDGSGSGELENENFSADQLVVRAIGHNIHPALGKGRMINASRGLAALIAQLPLASCSPESTAGREGFLHPYHISGGVGEAEVRILLRDFDTAKLDDHASIVTRAAAQVESQIPGIKFEIQRTRQYRNMSDSLKRHPLVVQLAVEAYAKLDIECKLGSIRGGTDGAMFSEKGLPTPNLSVGQHNIHAVTEFASLTEMTTAVAHAVELVQLWSNQRS